MDIKYVYPVKPDIYSYSYFQKKIVSRLLKAFL